MSKKRRKKASPAQPPPVPQVARPQAVEPDARVAADRPTEIQHADGRVEHPQVRHETSDVRFRGILTVILVAVGLGAAHFWWLWVFFGQREQHQRAIDASFYPNAAERSMQLPSEPRLEQLDRLGPPDRLSGSDAADIRRRELASEQLLASYGNTSDEGYVRVPIERAMEQVIGQLPVRKQSPTVDAAKDNGLLDSGASNSGRIFRGPRRW
jgi:hypothetical protein